MLLSMTRINWKAVTENAAQIVRSYSTSVTLRQLFYRLVSTQVIPNTESAYKSLSSNTAKARRDGWFPSLIDRGRSIYQPACFESPGDALEALRQQYRRDRTIGQDTSIYVGVEKAGMVIQLQSWFGDLGIPILALGGYSSETYVQQVAGHIRRHKRDEDQRAAHEIAEEEAFRARLVEMLPSLSPDVRAKYEHDHGKNLEHWRSPASAWRPAILLYAGDFDPSGEDIDRDFIDRCSAFEEVVRVALSSDQVQDYRLPVNPGKASDSRSGQFVARHGQLVQVELDALDPDVMRGLFQAEIDRFWDAETYAAVLEQEQADRQMLSEIAA